MTSSNYKLLSSLCFVLGFASILGSIAIWYFAGSQGVTDVLIAHAERFGIFAGLWAPTFFILSNRFTCFRDEGDEWGGLVSLQQEIPAAYFITSLHTIQSYTGPKPWQNDALSTIPSVFMWTNFVSSEKWAACVDSSGFGVGVFSLESTAMNARRAGNVTTTNTMHGSAMHIAPLVRKAFDRRSTLEYRCHLAWTPSRRSVEDSSGFTPTPSRSSQSLARQLPATPRRKRLPDRPLSSGNQLVGTEPPTSTDSRHSDASDAENDQCTNGFWNRINHHMVEPDEDSTPACCVPGQRDGRGEFGGDEARR